MLTLDQVLSFALRSRRMLMGHADTSIQPRSPIIPVDPWALRLLLQEEHPDGFSVRVSKGLGDRTNILAHTRRYAHHADIYISSGISSKWSRLVIAKELMSLILEDGKDRAQSDFNLDLLKLLTIEKQAEYNNNEASFLAALEYTYPWESRTRTSDERINYRYIAESFDLPDSIIEFYFDSGYGAISEQWNSQFNSILAKSYHGTTGLPSEQALTTPLFRLPAVHLLRKADKQNETSELAAVSRALEGLGPETFLDLPRRGALDDLRHLVDAWPDIRRRPDVDLDDGAVSLRWVGGDQASILTLTFLGLGKVLATVAGPMRRGFGPSIVSASPEALRALREDMRIVEFFKS